MRSARGKYTAEDVRIADAAFVMQHLEMAQKIDAQLTGAAAR
jgi:hypothetical protein